jgi:hypothetical protein
MRNLIDAHQGHTKGAVHANLFLFTDRPSLLRSRDVLGCPHGSAFRNMSPLKSVYGREMAGPPDPTILILPIPSLSPPTTKIRALALDFATKSTLSL